MLTPYPISQTEVMYWPVLTAPRGYNIGFLAGSELLPLITALPCFLKIILWITCSIESSVGSVVIVLCKRIIYIYIVSCSVWLCKLSAITALSLEPVRVGLMDFGILCLNGVHSGS